MPSLTMSNDAYDHKLDITGERCPMTYVRVRLALDRMAPEQVLLVALRGEEPAENVPRTAIEQGHEVLRADPGPDGVTRLWIRKAAARAG